MIREATNESTHRLELSESLFHLFHLLFTNASNSEQSSLIPALVSQRQQMEQSLEAKRI